MFDAYSVAVRLRLVNEVSHGLAAIATQFAATDTAAKALQKRIHAIKMQGVAGAALFGTGAVMVAPLLFALQESKKFQTEAAKFGSLGFGDKINTQAIQFASGMQTIGTSARENMAIVGDAMAVFKDLHETKMVAPLMAKMKFANQALFGANKGSEHDNKLMDMMKVAEFRGGTKSPEEFKIQVNYAQQAITGSRNRVDASAMLQALKTGGVGISRRTNQAFYLGAEPMIQEFGGMRYGTGVMSLYQNLVQAKGAITSQQELYRLGLLDKKMVQFNSLGMLKKALPGAFIGSKIQEEEGELALLKKVLLPAFAKHGITSDEDIIREIGRIAGNRTGSNLLTRIYQQRDKLEMQVAANFHAENLDQSVARAGGTLQGKQIDLQAKWHTLLKNLGDTVLPLACIGVEKLTGLLKFVNQSVEKYPLLTKTMASAFMGLAASLMFGGMVNLVAAGFKGIGLGLSLLTSVKMAGLVANISGAGGLVSALTGNAGLVIAAGAAGFAIGTLINKLVGIDKGEFGNWLYDVVHKNDKDQLGWKGNQFVGVEKNPNWSATTQGQTPRFQTVRPGSNNKPVQVNTKLYLDGRKIADVVTNHQAREAEQPHSGLGGMFDSIMAPVPVGY